MLRFQNGEVSIRRGGLRHVAHYEMRGGWVTVSSEDFGTKTLRCGDLPPDLVAHAALRDLAERPRSAARRPVADLPAVG